MLSAKTVSALALAMCALAVVVSVANADTPYLTSLITVTSSKGGRDLVIDTDSAEVKGYSTWAGNLTLSTGADGEKLVRADIYDSDGDAFFAVRLGAGSDDHCVLDANVNLNTDKALLTVFKQNGLSCHVSAHRPDESTNTYRFSVTATATHSEDCDWNGTHCA